MSFQSQRAHYNGLGRWVPASHRATGYNPAPVNAEALAAVLATISRAVGNVPPAKPVMSAANRTRRAAMLEAWAIKREERGRAFGDCLRTAWAIIKGLGARPA